MRKYAWPLFLFLLLILALSLTVVFISERTSFFGRAFTPSIGSGEVSVQNSYLFASPLSASAAGKEKIRVTIFVLDGSGRGVYGLPVILGENKQLVVTSVQPTSDDLGRAIFDVTTDQPGEYFLEALVGSRVLSQRVRVVFR